MSDVVERLKSRAAPLTRARELSPTAALCREAAAEIERLRGLIPDAAQPALPSAEEIAKIIDPFCATALENERAWCEKHGKDFHAWASGYIARWDDALLRARAIIALAAEAIEDAEKRGTLNEPPKMLVDADWLRRKVETDPDMDADVLPELPHGSADKAEVSIMPMALSDGRTDYFVQIKVGDRAVTPHVFREEYKSAYHVALYDWLLNGNGEEPDCVEFGPNDWPGRVMPDVPQTEQAWCQPMDCGKHTPRKFFLYFDDPDHGNAVFDDESEARAAFERASTAWNCYLFGAMPLAAQPPAAPVAPRKPVCCYCDNDLCCAHCGREQPDDSEQPLAAPVEMERNRCIAICEGWIGAYQDREIQYTTPREYAIGAIEDIIDLIRSGHQPEAPECGAESNRHSGAVGAMERAEQSNPGGGHVTEPDISNGSVSDKPPADEPTPPAGRLARSSAETSGQEG